MQFSVKPQIASEKKVLFRVTSVTKMSVFLRCIKICLNIVLIVHNLLLHVDGETYVFLLLPVVHIMFWPCGRLLKSVTSVTCNVSHKLCNVSHTYQVNSL